MNNAFNEEERQLIASYLLPTSKWCERSTWYVVYILPSALFALFGLWHRDYAATLVAYLALFVTTVWFLSYSTRYSNCFRSILMKYESQINALRSEHP
jgi:hypothetical protein